MCTWHALRSVVGVVMAEKHETAGGLSVWKKREGKNPSPSETPNSISSEMNELNPSHFNISCTSPSPILHYFAGPVA